MAIVRITPTPIDVACDWFDGRPRSVRVADVVLPIVSVDRIREESAAYPLESGPRTLFEVSTSETRMMLTFRHRDRRWLVEGLEPEAYELATAA